MWPFLHATPDFLYKCHYCGRLWKSAHMHIASDSYVQKNFFCLERNGSVLSLERDHNYYYQAQQQIHTTGRD